MTTMLKAKEEELIRNLSDLEHQQHTAFVHACTTN